MQDIEDKERYINTGRLIHILSNQMKRRNASEAVGDDGLTTMQKHVLKHILLETMHREVYQKDIEEEFRIRKSTATLYRPQKQKHSDLRFWSTSEIPKSG